MDTSAAKLNLEIKRNKPNQDYMRPPQLFQPLKISDGSLKKLDLYKVVPLPKLDSYARKQNSVLSRNVAGERV